jgi:hypothetical protein
VPQQRLLLQALYLPLQERLAAVSTIFWQHLIMLSMPHLLQKQLLRHPTRQKQCNCPKKVLKDAPTCLPLSLQQLPQMHHPMKTLCLPPCHLPRHPAQPQQQRQWHHLHAHAKLL